VTREAPDRTEQVWFKIGQASRLVGATPKELRYWEKVIPELCPRRSKGNLRYYHQEELVRLQRIRQWLSEGFTVSDCRELLQGIAPTASKPSPAPPSEAGRDEASPLRSGALEAVLSALRALHRRLGLPAGAQPAPVGLPPSPAGIARKTRQAPAEKITDAPKCREPEPPKEESGLLLQEPEGGEKPETQEPPAASPPPRRGRKPKADTSVLGRMWSEARLPLDLDE
jgi:DNA-binding transcriptional MerR regulator